MLRSPRGGGRPAQDQVRELAQLPVRVSGTQALFDVEERSQFPGTGRRRGVEFLRVDSDPHAVPVPQLEPVPTRGSRAEGEARRVPGQYRDGRSDRPGRRQFGGDSRRQFPDVGWRRVVQRLRHDEGGRRLIPHC